MNGQLPASGADARSTRGSSGRKGVAASSVDGTSCGGSVVDDEGGDDVGGGVPETVDPKIGSTSNADILDQIMAEAERE